MRRIKLFHHFVQLSRTTSYGFLKPCENSGKTKDPIQRKRLDRRTDGRKDGQTLFQRTLPAIMTSCYKSYKNPANIYLFKSTIETLGKRYEICSKLIIKTPERRQFFSSVSIVDFEQLNVSWEANGRL